MGKIRCARRYYLNAKEAWDPQALMSDSAYDEGKHDARHGEKLRDLGWEMDRDLSDGLATVYHHKGRNHTTIAYRGTKPQNTDDLAADLDVLAGKRNHHRFKDALDRVEQVKRKYGSDKGLSVTGHSLGGSLALHVNDKLNIPARVYNPGSSPIFRQTINKDNVHVVRNAGDLVSSGLRARNMETRNHNTKKRGLLSQIFQPFQPPITQIFHWLEDHGIGGLLKH